MKYFVSFLSFIVVAFSCFGQDEFIQIETNRTLGLFNFLETSSGQLGTSRSLKAYILDAFDEDENFNEMVRSYSTLELENSIERREFPDKRPAFTSVRDLLWISVSNSSSIDDFSDRIIGFLPHQTHIKLITLLKQCDPYYESLIWSKEQENIRKLEKQLSNYTDQIADLYLKISTFYNSSRSTTIPFKIMLYPIPLKKGYTTAIPKGNALICSFLSKDENDYKTRLGIIIHEMCHILYEAQTAEFQHELDGWFKNSEAPEASLAYSFINEALATSLGNGWAHKEIHTYLDTNEWYNNRHIDGFAHAIFPLVETYLDGGKTIDEPFIDKSIELFGQTFPKATVETDILMNSVQIFANTEVTAEINDILNLIHNYFNIRSMWFSSPTTSMESQEYYHLEELTKLFIIDSNNKNTINALQEHYSHLTIETPINTISVIKDNKAKSTLIVINIEGIKELKSAYTTLSAITYLEDGKNYKIE